MVGKYFYDGDGKRARKLVPSTGETTIFHYDAAGQRIAEYSTAVDKTKESKLMKTSFLLLSIFSYLAFSTSVIAQNKNSQVQKAETDGDVRTVKIKPHVFIAFEKEGKIEPPYEGESENRIWLRFHNNSKWKVMFYSHDIPKEYGDTQIAYEIERYRGSGDTPSAGSTDSCPYLLIESGKSVGFSVPREHLLDGLAIRIPFHYEWEIDRDGSVDPLEPTHFVYFYSEDIPKLNVK